MPRNRRKDDFHGSTAPGQGDALGAASQNHRESNHGETGKGNPIRGLKAKSVKWPNHGGFGSHFRGIRYRIVALPIRGTFRFAMNQIMAKPEKAPRFGAHTQICLFGEIIAVSKSHHGSL